MKKDHTKKQLFSSNYQCNYIQYFFSLGTNSSMFTNCSVFCDVRHVRSLILGQNVMFGSVRSSVLLLCDQTSLGTYSLMFANCSVFCDVQYVRSSILGQNVMFGMFDVWTFNIRSVRSSVFCCSFQHQRVLRVLSYVTSLLFICEAEHIPGRFQDINISLKK